MIFRACSCCTTTLSCIEQGTVASGDNNYNMVYYVIHASFAHNKDMVWNTIYSVYIPLPPEEKVWGVQVPAVWPHMVQWKQLGGHGPRVHDMPHHSSPPHPKGTAEARWARRWAASPQWSVWNVQETGIQLQEQILDQKDKCIQALVVYICALLS